MKDGYLNANGLRFHYVEDGPIDGQLVVLLHGFPEFWYSWRHQLPVLAEHGMRVVAPDLRGYNLSDKPNGIDSYDLDVLARDVVEIIAALGAERAMLVGHDWGGAVAWHVAARHPERVSRLAVLACPHPEIMAQALRRNLRQLRRSWYMFFFQLPFLPERLMSGRRVQEGLQAMTVRPGVFSPEDLARYAEAAERPGAMHAALNYYRAGMRRRLRLLHEPSPPVRVPTLLVWGEQDRALGVELTKGLEHHVSASWHVEVLPGVGHFLPQEAPEEINRLLLEFLD